MPIRESESGVVTFSGPSNPIQVSCFKNRASETDARAECADNRFVCEMLRPIGRALDKRPPLKTSGFRFLLLARLLVPLAGCGAPSNFVAPNPVPLASGTAPQF